MRKLTKDFYCVSTCMCDKLLKSIMIKRSLE